MTVCTGDVKLATVFSDLVQAKDAILVSSGCPVKKSSSEGGKYVTFQCFRSGVYKKKDSKVFQELQRKSSSSIWNELGALATKCTNYPTSTIISCYGWRTASAATEPIHSWRSSPEVPWTERTWGTHLPSTYHSIEVHFPDVKVTWTTRDVQNLLQSTVKHSHETQEFVQLLDKKKNDGWLVSVYHKQEPVPDSVRTVASTMSSR